MNSITVKVLEKRCEYKENPLGIDTPKPRFSWKIESEEQNTIKTVYENNVTEEKGNLVLNSGKKATDHSV